MTKNSPHSALTISYKDRHIEAALSLKFRGMQLDNHLNWKDHIDQILPKLSTACYAVRQMHHICDENTKKSIYFAYFHSIIKYGIIFWGNSSNNKEVFTLQKKVIRIMVGAHSRTSKIRDFTSP